MTHSDFKGDIMKTRTHQENRALGIRDLDDWLNQLNQICGHFQAHSLSEKFCGNIKTFEHNSLNLSCVNARSAQLYRTRRDVSNDDFAHYYAIFQVNGYAYMEQNNYRARLDPRDIMLLDASRPCRFQFDKMSRQISLVLPRDTLETTLCRSHINYTQRISGQSHLGHLAYQMIASSTQPQNATDTEDGEAIITALLTLLQPLLVGKESVAPHKQKFDKAVAIINDRLYDPNLTPACVASEVGVSVRSLYRIFAARKLPVAQYIRDRRLVLSAQRLRQSFSEEQLSSLCFACGFSDPSYFSTAFKRHFGMSPTQYRALYQH
ncbi:transcriptional regulator FeaR [Halomonas piscis]|uniref:Transcriptional regulator FeaR n=1 Tax=Halomonas piscis TaxID=3031727 RepID=A0ABY9YYY6_9GAMM|nr:transcriptional regulator FeaR [Halomonas piscis]WNK20079.1 transcriptional regulator FeaR [Halomonas piscis]